MAKPEEPQHIEESQLLQQSTAEDNNSGDEIEYRGLAGVSTTRRSFDDSFTRFLYRLLSFMARHWLFILNAFAGVIAGLPFLAPYLLSVGASVPAAAIYFIYQFACHQLPERSFFLFGEQMALCQRDAAVCVSFFLAGLAFAFVRRWLRPLDFRLYLLLIAPLVIDGALQLFGLYESAWETRTFTGILFGAGSMWLIYPQFEQIMANLRSSVQHQE